MDTEAIAWAMQKLQAFGIRNSMGSAMMMDRLHIMLAAAPTPPANERNPYQSDDYRANIAECLKIENPTPPEQDWEEVDRLIKTLRYIQGIAERGEGRKMRADEGIGEFVLNYVKKLEAPAQEDAPVGFLFRAKTDNRLTHFCRMEELSFWQTVGEVELLYTRPADDKPRKAEPTDELPLLQVRVQELLPLLMNGIMPSREDLLYLRDLAYTRFEPTPSDTDKPSPG